MADTYYRRNAAINIPTINPDLSRFLTEKILPYAQQPYRVDMVHELKLELATDGCLVVHEQSTCICKSFRGQIQKELILEFEPDELLSLEKLQFWATYPAGHPKEGDVEVLEPDEPICFGSIAKSGMRVRIDLQRFASVDGLRISNISSHRRRAECLGCWRFLLPTKGFELRFEYPEDYLSIEVFTFVPDPSLTLEERRPNLLRIRHEGWAFYMNGIAWRFGRK